MGIEVFGLPGTHFGGPIGEPLALVKCRTASVLLYELHLRMLKFYEIL